MARRNPVCFAAVGAAAKNWHSPSSIWMRFAARGRRPGRKVDVHRNSVPDFHGHTPLVGR
jgi:hypothetical protein